jgi:hypothetical protein
MSSIKKEADQKANGQKYGSLARSKMPKTEVTDFYVYSRAGAPKRKKQ